jgi:ribosomal protein S18 acetylase RimI-like enzyme
MTGLNSPADRFREIGIFADWSAKILSAGLSFVLQPWLLRAVRLLVFIRLPQRVLHLIHWHRKSRRNCPGIQLFRRFSWDAWAVDHRHQGKGLGSALIADALARTARAELGIFAMVVNAKDEAAQRFYEHFGFTLLPGETRRLCLPIATAVRGL